jgi:hypothetical protein
MTGRNLDATASASRPARVPLGSASAGAAPHDGRRALLTGGLAAGSLFVTLSSRPAVAAAQCTISGMISGVGSVHTAPAVGGCGSTPSCWKTRITSWQHYTTTTPFKATFLSGLPGPGTLAYSGSDYFLDVLNNPPSITFTFGNSNTATANAALAGNCVAALLNAALFGSDYLPNHGQDYFGQGSAANVQSIIKGYFTAASEGRNAPAPGGSVGNGNGGKRKNAQAAMDTLLGKLTTWNAQGGAC